MVKELLLGKRFLWGGNENVLELDSGNGLTTLWIYLKKKQNSMNLKRVNFMIQFYLKEKKNDRGIKSSTTKEWSKYSFINPTFSVHLLCSRPMRLLGTQDESKVTILSLGSFSSAYKCHIFQEWSSFENAKTANISHR